MTEIITKDLVTKILPVRNENSNKGDFGKVLNIVSSEKYIGAGILAAIAALRTGAGYSIFCSCENVIKRCNFIPDLIYKSNNDFNFDIVKNTIENENITSIVLGCGISTEENVKIFTEKIINYLLTTNIPVVIDADGLNILSRIENITLNENFILTPHPKELSRLINIEVDEIEKNRENFARQAQEKYNATVILKGHNTIIATNKDDIYENFTGNSALAKGGSGDVLAGMIGGFLAQKISCENASILSVYLHGLAGDIYANEYSAYSLLPSELVNYIPLAIKSILSH